MRSLFRNELADLHKDVLKMSTALETTIDKMLFAFTRRDIAALQEVVERDDMIDDLESEIERKCISLILQQQPVAADLRNVASVLKLITDIERIADHCTDIALYLKKIILLNQKAYCYDITEILNMSKCVKKMVSETIDAYVNLDAKKAVEISISDDEIDAYFINIAEDLKSKMKLETAFIEEGVKFLYIIKYLERMADHATNICEWVVYRVTGERNQYN